MQAVTATQTRKPALQSRPSGHVLADAALHGLTAAAGLLTIGLVAAIAVTLWRDSAGLHRSLSQTWQFLRGTEWDPVAEHFGALPFLYGSLLTSALALLLAVPVGVGAAIFLAEVVPGRLSQLLTTLTDLLGTVPSVIYGLLGLMVLVPWMRQTAQPALSRWLGFLPLFAGPPYGVGFLTAGVLLAVMILPFQISASRDALKAVPRTLREAALALGATPWETIARVVLPEARSGILAGTLLALGRALGETMAVTMVIGNAPTLSISLFSPGYTIPAAIANEFTEATGPLHLQALEALGLVLLVMALITHVLGQWVPRRLRRGTRCVR